MEYIEQHHWPPPNQPKTHKEQVFGREMVELRSPDLWGVPFDAEFHARFAHEGPKAARAQFRGKRAPNQIRRPLKAVGVLEQTRRSRRKPSSVNSADPSATQQQSTAVC